MNRISQGAAVSFGWSNEEEARLLAKAENCRVNGRPLREAFASFAAETGRKPNSIRNHYYMMVKERGIATAEGNSRPFLPFNDAEVVSLLRAFLTAQTMGESVRACALRIGGGDNKAMLRYQNKYRSVLKKKPELVSRIVHELRQEGVPAINPYDRIKAMKMLSSENGDNHDIVGYVSQLVNELSELDEVNAETFFRSLSALASAASARKNMSDDTLKRHIERQNETIKAQDESFKRLLSMFRRLIRLNYDFLNQNNVKKVSSLAAYINELAPNVSECEKLMAELRDDGEQII